MRQPWVGMEASVCGQERRLTTPKRERKCSVNGHRKPLLIRPELIQLLEGSWLGLLRGCLLSFEYKKRKSRAWKRKRKAQSALYRASDAALKAPSQPSPFSMPSKLLILHGEANSYCFTVSCVPESMFHNL